MSNKKTNLFNALAKFIEAMRLYLFTGLNNQYGEAWERKYCESLLHIQKEHWGKKLQEGTDPIQLIDYGNLKSFALNNRSFFERDFGRQRNNLPTIFNQISEARNMLNHYEEFDNDKAEKAYLHMIDIAKKLNMNELKNDLRRLKDGSFKHVDSPIKRSNPVASNLKSSENKFKKSDAIKIINNYLGENKLSYSNTAYSNLNKTIPCWWLNILPAKFNNSLNLLLVEKNEIIWINNIPREILKNYRNYFRIREDNLHYGKIDLRIDAEGNNYLKETYGGEYFDFKPYIKKRIRIK